MKGLFGKLLVVLVVALPILLAACGKKEEPAGDSSGATGPGPKADSDRGSAGRTRGDGGGGK